VSVTAYHSFAGEVEGSNTPTIRRLTLSRRHQLSPIAPRMTSVSNIRPIIRATVRDPLGDDRSDRSHICVDCAVRLLGVPTRYSIQPTLIGVCLAVLVIAVAVGTGWLHYKQIEEDKREQLSR